MSLEPSLNLTFGVEMECVISVTRKQFRSFRAEWAKQYFIHSGEESWVGDGEKESKDRERVYFTVSRILTAAGIPTNDPTSPRNNRAYEAFIDEPDYSKWTIEDDFSVRPLSPRECAAVLKREVEREQAWARQVAKWREEDEQRRRERRERGEPSSESASSSGAEDKGDEEDVDVEEEDDEEEDEGGDEEGNEGGDEGSDEEGNEGADQNADEKKENGEIEDEGNEDDKLLFSAEIVTRILPYGAEGFQELQAGLRSIHANFNAFPNNTTALHIHAGNQSKGFSKRTVKNFIQLVTAFEHIIESLYPDDYLLSLDCRDYAKSPSQSKVLESWNILDRLLQTEECDDIPSLMETINPRRNREWAYNFQNLLQPMHQLKPREPTLTIEMRQHPGSLDAQDIITWADFTIGLLNFAHEAPSPQVLMLCVQYSTDPDFTVLDLMRVIGKPHIIAYYQDKLTIRPRPNLHILTRGSTILGVYQERFEGRHPSLEEWRQSQRRLYAPSGESGTDDRRRGEPEGNPSPSEPATGDEENNSNGLGCLQT